MSKVQCRSGLRCGMLAVVAGVLLLAFAPIAQAADNGSWSVEPTSPKGVVARQYLVYDVAAGSTIRDSVTIKNSDKVVQQFRIYGADGYTTEYEGGFGLKSAGEPQTAVGAWTTMSKKTLTLRPGASVKVPFTLKVPDGTAPGDHVGAVVALNTAVEAGGGAGPNIGVQRAVATRIYLRVQGPVNAGLSVESVWVDHSRSQTTVHYILANTGNIRLQPTSVVTIDGPFGRTLQELKSANLGMLAPGQKSEYSQEAKKLPVVGYVTATVAATANEASAVESTRVVLLPRWFIAVVALVLIALALNEVRRRRRRRKTGRRRAEPVVQAEVSA